MRAAIVGAGALGARAARQLLTLGDVDDLLVADLDDSRARAVARSLGAPARSVDVGSLRPADVDVVVLAHPAPEVAAREALRAGAHVVVTTGALGSARELAALDAEARERRRCVVIGAAMSPGLSCLLAVEAARPLDSVISIETASTVSGGPACLKERRRALATDGARWDGAWQRERSGSGRRLAVFPDPIGPTDCFAAGTAEAFLLASVYPAARVSAAVAASFAERRLAALPGLPLRGKGTALSAVRVEVHGRLPGGAAEARVLGALDHPAHAGGAVAAVAAHSAAGGRLTPGAGGLATSVEDVRGFLGALSRLGVRAAEYTRPY